MLDAAPDATAERLKGKPEKDEVEIAERRQEDEDPNEEE